MLASKPIDIPTNEAGNTPLYFCQFDADRRPVFANYALSNDTQHDLPANIRAAYGVTPHPDMPDGVYSRMNLRLQNFVGAAGYYYCVTADGQPFWIAVGLYPTTNGIIACHFQVTSPSLSPFVKFFAYLKRAEQAGLDPEQSAKQLLELMVKEGVSDYRAVAAGVMMEEMGKRCRTRQRPQYLELQLLNEMLETLRLIETYGKDIGAKSERSKLIPHKLKLQAAKLEGGRGPISVIAGNHQALTGAMLQITADMQKASATEIDKVIDAIAYLAQSNQAAELIENGVTEGSGISVKADLREVIYDCAERVKGVLSDIDTSILTLISINHKMRRALSAMEMTRIMCKVERANLDGESDGLSDIVDQLQQVEQSLSRVMSQIDDASKKALGLVVQMNRGIVCQAA